MVTGEGGWEVEKKTHVLGYFSTTAVIIVEAQYVQYLHIRCEAFSASTRSISRLCTRAAVDTSGLAELLGWLLPWILLVLKYFGVLYCGVSTANIGSISPVGTGSTAINMNSTPV